MAGALPKPLRTGSNCRAIPEACPVLTLRLNLLFTHPFYREGETGSDTVSYQEAELVNQPDLAKSRAELGSAFVRILSYFREDGEKAISAIEQAIRERNAIALGSHAEGRISPVRRPSAERHGRTDRNGRAALCREPRRT